MPVAVQPEVPTLYARTVGGMRQFWCPDCGTFVNKKVPPAVKTAVIRCKHCKATFYWGVTLYRPLGAAGEPPDQVIPLFAEIHPERIRKGQPINRLRQLNADGTWTEL